EQVRTVLARRWRSELSQAARYLLAASAPQSESKVNDVGLDVARFAQWVKALQQDDLARSDHPLHAWHRLRKGEAPPTAVASKPGQQHPLADFRQPNFGDWYVTGDAFGSQPAALGEIVVGDQPGRPIARLASGGADSGLLSPRLQGELRSPSFTIDK